MNTLYFWGKPICQSTFTSCQQQSLISEACIQESILSISCGFEHCIIQSTQNQLFAFGDNSEGQLGLNTLKKQCFSFSKILLPIKSVIRNISCGWHHTLIITEQGDVFSCGKGIEGALGHSHGQNSHSFKFVLKGAKTISAGLDHSLALCGSKVKGWGNSKDGQLGLLKKKIYFEPVQLNVYPSVDIFAGPKYSFFVTSKGLYGTGMNQHCQLGLGHQNTIFMAKKILLDETIIKIQGGNYVTALTQTNQRYFWGDGSFGLFKYPTKLSFLEETEMIQLSANFGVLRKNNREVCVWGCNLNGELGLKSRIGKQYLCENEELTKLQLDLINCGGNFCVGYRQNIQNSSQKYMQKKSEEINQFGTLKSVSSLKNPSKNLKNIRSRAQNGQHISKNTLQTQNLMKVETLQLENRLLRQELQKYGDEQNELTAKIQCMEDYYEQMLQKVKLENRQTTKNNEKQKQIELQNKNLLEKLADQKEYINKIREQYLSLSSMVENNSFLKNILELGDQNYRQKQVELYNSGGCVEDQSDDFGMKIKILKQKLEEIYFE